MLVLHPLKPFYTFKKRNNMKNKSNLFKAISTLLLAVFLMTNLSGCKKIKDTIEEAWEGYWAGVFDLGEGWQIELEGNRAEYVTAGVSKVGTNLGDPFAIGMELIGNNKWRGYIADKNGFGFLGLGTAEIIDNKLKITPDGGTPYTLNKGVKKTSTGGSGGSTGGSTGGTTQTLVNQKVEGKQGDKIIFKITVPTGVKQLEIRTTEVAGSYYFNVADMFVRKGSDPTVTLTPKYSWSADCASIESNRADEVCTFSNPSSGVYHVMLFGYNSSFISQLVVKIVK